MVTSSKIKNTIVIAQKFDYLYRAENGNFVAVVVNPDGSTTESEIDIRKNPSQTLITDGKGDSLVYSQNGQVMGIKEYRATGGNAALLKDYHSKSDSLAQWQINFLPYEKQTYAFDYRIKKTLVFDVLINLDPTIFVDIIPNNKLKKIVLNWSKILTIIKKKYQTLYQSGISSLGNTFEKIYYHHD